MMLVFCGHCYLRSYLALKLFIPYVKLKKLILNISYLLLVKKKKNIIDCLSVVPINDLTDILS